jgi:hypothetical protein
MLHHHESLTDPDVRDVHCRLLHSGACSEDCDGLHWHFAMAKDVNGKPESPSDETPSETAVFALATAIMQMEGDGCCRVADLLTISRELICAYVVRLGSFEASVKATPPTVFASRMSDVASIAVTGVCLI